MHHDTASELSFAPRFRPFYPGDVQGYSSALDSLVYPGELSVQDSNPRMSLEACRLVGGGLAISFTSTPLAVRHDTALASPSGSGDVLAMIAVEGEGTIDQGGRRLPFCQGDITFRTTRLPSVCTLTTPGKLVMLRVPAGRFFGIHADLHDRFVPSIAQADSRLAEAARTHMGHVFPGPVQGTPALAYFSEQSFVSLLAATYCESCELVDDDVAEGKRRERDRWQRLVAYIEAHLGDAELSVNAVSKELGISKRLTHRLFEMQRTQYGAYLKTRRLERAKEELANRRLDHLSVSEIAYRNGFGDASHFSRCFRSQFGTPPGAWRRSPA
ncbi:AraC family transcriptional regulator [Variovorax sp. ZS18.2.2]|uniref:AraC family transcriptional regulator n=1 Tax=Variovorax sp. ZS18.2.2 TaxID=2971255 RepID=UPI00215169F5|nr:AraC family transcriptional regulator [Variovorax sp. ZS18.2.2]MCR6480531.1 AraC family transcriptional regulator [Variovorax sp. ZS18.2.2]